MVSQYNRIKLTGSILGYEGIYVRESWLKKMLFICSSVGTIVGAVIGFLVGSYL